MKDSSDVCVIIRNPQVQEAIARFYPQLGYASSLSCKLGARGAPTVSAAAVMIAGKEIRKPTFKRDTPVLRVPRREPRESPTVAKR